jgi:hypothetical protein
MLDELPAVEPSATLQRRVFEIPARYPKAEPPKWLAFLLGPRAAVLAVVLLALGAASGWASSEGEDTVVDSSEEESSQWEELSELALATDLSEDF